MICFHSTFCLNPHFVSALIFFFHLFLLSHTHHHHVGELDGREVNVQVPPKGDKGGQGQGVIDLNNPTQMASDVFRFAQGAGKGKGVYVRERERERVCVCVKVCVSVCMCV